MTAYALEHPNPRAKRNSDGTYWGYDSRKGDRVSGVVVVHSAEVAPDYVGEDRGAENTAAYFTHSDRAASYHRIADSDSVVEFLPFSHTAFHDATGTNRHSIGVSMGTQAHTWGTNPAHDEAMLRNAASAVADALRYAAARNHDDPSDYARWITPEQARRQEPGLVEHGEMDPGRRSDPWTAHRLRPDLRARLLAYVREDLGSPAPPTKDWFDMATKAELDEVVKARVAESEARILEQIGGARGDVLSVGVGVQKLGTYLEGELTPEGGRSLRKLAEMAWNVHHEGNGKVRGAVKKLFGID